jgi:hypothetical protein
MDLRHASGLGRPVDLSFATNRWIVGLTGAVLVLAWVWRGLASEAWLAAGVWAGLAALAMFLAWALARELDPDAELAAFLAAGLMLPLLVLAGLGWLPLPDIAALAAVLLAVRVLNRTTGIAATPLDGIAVLGLGLWLALDGLPVYLAAAAVALVVDGLLPPLSGRRVLVATAAVAVTVVIVLIFAQEPPGLQLGLLPIVAALAIAALFGTSLHATGDLNAVGDETGEPLSTLRVRAGQMLALAVGLAAVVWTGSAGMVALLPLWTAMVALGGIRAIRAISAA